MVGGIFNSLLILDSLLYDDLLGVKGLPLLSQMQSTRASPGLDRRGVWMSPQCLLIANCPAGPPGPRVILVRRKG